jgi:hypothetical protein
MYVKNEIIIKYRFSEGNVNNDFHNYGREGIETRNPHIGRNKSVCMGNISNTIDSYFKNKKTFSLLNAVYLNLFNYNSGSLFNTTFINDYPTIMLDLIRKVKNKEIDIEIFDKKRKRFNKENLARFRILYNKYSLNDLITTAESKNIEIPLIKVEL